MGSPDDDRPFVNVATVDALYRSEQRLAQRVRTLLGAKLRGSDPVDVAIDHLPAGRVALDVGCGLGGATAKLAARMAPETLIAFDRSTAMLEATGQRVPRALLVLGDFHQLPFQDATIDLVVAAFCLYHSPAPHEVCSEIARCLSPGGVAALITKGRDSYREIDRMLVEATVDRDAMTRTSLYETFSTENAREIASRALRIDAMVCERHEFGFRGPADLASYVQTSPKYPGTRGAPEDALRAAFADVWPPGPLIATSEVAVLIGRAP